MLPSGSAAQAPQVLLKFWAGVKLGVQCWDLRLKTKSKGTEVQIPRQGRQPTTHSLHRCHPQTWAPSTSVCGPGAKGPQARAQESQQQTSRGRGLPPRPPRPSPRRRGGQCPAQGDPGLQPLWAPTWVPANHPDSCSVRGCFGVAGGRDTAPRLASGLCSACVIPQYPAPPQ